jgi:hypothetical protein
MWLALTGFKRLFIFLCFLLFSPFILRGQILTLYSFPSPHPYKWNSPHSLLVSTLHNYYSKPQCQPRRILGHLVIELKKDTNLFLTGMASDDIAGMKNSLLKEKIGLGVLFKLVKGHLEETSEVQAELKMRTELSRAAFISFKINDSAYNYLLAFLDSFKLKGYDSLYNGLNLPREGKGSGCTAFGMSLLELINALLPEYTDKWAVRINVPEKLIGNESLKKKVSISKIFFSFRWAKGDEPSRKLVLYEPCLIYNWVNNIWKTRQQDNKYGLVQMGQAKGLVVDCRQNLPVLPMFIR